MTTITVQIGNRDEAFVQKILTPASSKVAVIAAITVVSQVLAQLGVSCELLEVD